MPATPLKSMDTAEGFEEHRQWEHTLADAGYAVVSWPKELGGRDASLLEWVIFEEEYYRSGAPGRVSQNGIFLLAPTLFEHANAEQLARIMPRMARADDIWAQAWSEPESGSDLASLRSSAKKVDGGWLLNGQKTWSSTRELRRLGLRLVPLRSGCAAPQGHHVFHVRPPVEGCPPFARSISSTVSPASPRSSSKTSSFRTTRPNPGESGVIGNVNEGWRVAMSTASNERGLSLRSPGRFLATVDRLLELYKSSGRTDDSALRNQVADAWIGARAYQLNTFGTVTRLADGGQLGAESSINKVFWSEWDIATHETALELQGPEAELADNWMDGYLFSLSGPIYAGTNEIQKKRHR